MDNLGILIQAILSLKDTEDSKKQIIKELPKLERELKSDEKARVKIVAGLNTTESKKLIQSQLDTLTNQSKAPTIKVGIDISAVKKAVNPCRTVQAPVLPQIRSAPSGHSCNCENS